MKLPVTLSVLVTLLGAAISDGSAAQASGLTRVSQLQIADNESYGPYAWSPDSRYIAVSSAVSGGLTLVDVRTGEARHTNAPQSLASSIAWSRDGALVAVSFTGGLVVIGVRDLAPVLISNWNTAGAPSTFGWSLAFAPDGSHLFVDDDKPDKSGTLLYSLDLATKEYAPLVKSPFGNRRVLSVALTNDFHYIAGKLFYTPWLRKYDEETLPPGTTNREMSTRPSSCLAFELQGSGEVVSTARRDFPPGGEVDPFDGSRDVLGCQYMPDQDLFEVARVVPPYHLDAQGVPVEDGVGAFFEAISVASLDTHGRFGPRPVDGAELDVDPDQYTTHPTAPWAVAMAIGQSGRAILVWNVLTGDLLAQTSTDSSGPHPQFSPNGNYLAVEELDKISIFKVH